MPVRAEPPRRGPLNDDAKGIDDTMSWIGARLKRVEDPRLLRGEGVFVDDLKLPGMLHAAILRSSHAHASLKAIDVRRARALPGVHAILTGADVAGALNPIPVTWKEHRQKNWANPVLPVDRVRFVGEPIGVVLADSRYVAEDALDLIAVDVEPLPAVVDVEQATAPGAPLLHPEWGDNIAAEYHHQGGDVDAAFAAADRVIEKRFRIQRHTAFPIENRGAIAAVDRLNEVLTVWTSTQTPHHVRTVLAEALRFPENRIRIIAPDVGGGFGQKEHLYPEEVLVSLLALRTGRPVKWIEDRRENFIGSIHAREQVADLAMALRGDGTILGTKITVWANVGGYQGNVGIGPATKASLCLTEGYRYGSHRGDVYAVVTNKTPTGAYRGFGSNKAALMMERMVDIAARELGLDPAAMRFQNFIRPEDQPYVTPAGLQYDSGDYPACLRRALAMVGYEALREEQRRLCLQGRYLGIGIGHYVERTGLGPSRGARSSPGFDLGGFETGVVEVDPNGTVALYTGASPHGQGHETMLAQVIADHLGVTPEMVRVYHGDTATAPYSPSGTISSRSAPNAGAAAMQAARSLRERILAVAADRLEASPQDVVMEDGRITVRGSPMKGITLAQVATILWKGRDLPPGTQIGLRARSVYDPPGVAYTFSTHVCVVEVDPETGGVAFRKYAVVHDCGTLINPTLVEGQIHGGVVQGLGGITTEDLVYDAGGQILTTSFMDYLLPTAADVPPIDVEHMETPSPHNPLGVKGMGEGGVMGANPAVANAIADALAPFGVCPTEMPLTPSRIVALLRQAPIAMAVPHA